MFQAFRDEYLGSLNTSESTSMICEIGAWKQITWEHDAAQRVFHYCGGHPLITRYFASAACEGGALKAINYEQAEETAEEIRSTIGRNDFGDYYREGVWGELREDEQQVLSVVCKNGAHGLPEAEISHGLDDALTNLERFGLVASDGGIVRIPAHLFRTWVESEIDE